MQRASPLLAVFGLALLCALGAPARAEAEEAEAAPARKGDTINWTSGVAKAFEKAAELKRPVMICINSVRVDGGKVEPAAKGLREIIYKDPRIVTKSRAFVCVFVTSEGSSDDYGELRIRFGIDGQIVSPQHVFARPDHQSGTPPLARREYWPFRIGEPSVKALGEMMDKALAEFRVQAGLPPTPEPPGDRPGEGPGEGPGESNPEGGEPAPDIPAADAERQKWIEKMIHLVKMAVESKRREALALLMANDKDGDCINPVVALLTELAGDKEKLGALTDVVRAVGRPGLEAAAEPLHGFLKHKDDGLRANAAVSLEYIGSKTSMAPLLSRAPREKDETIANHMYRALGRCGAGESKVRSLLCKKTEGSKSQEGAYGPIVGLAYFEKDAKAARAVEKMLKKIGPGGGRRGWGNTMRRGLLVWTLVQIGDPKSADFILERMLKPLENSNSRWIGPVREYYANAAKACNGDEEAKGAVDEGAKRALSFAGGSAKIRDEARKDRDISLFEPKADWDVEARDFGGFGGGKGKK